MDYIFNRVNEATQWNNHLPLLYLALEQTKTGDVVEMGCGDGSTLWLHDYCLQNNRLLHSFDTSVDWLGKFKHLISSHHSINHINDWGNTPIDGVSVVLIDHAPGERRYIDANRYKDINGILVCHDTEEPPCGGNYQWDKAFINFKYFARIKAKSADGIHNGAWATAVSNTHDMSHWIGQTFGEYTVEA